MKFLSFPLIGPSSCFVGLYSIQRVKMTLLRTFDSLYVYNIGIL